MSITAAQIREELQSYEQLLCAPADYNGMAEMIQKGTELVGYLARSAVLVSEAGKLHGQAKVRAYLKLKTSSEAQQQYYSPMLAKDYVAAQCAEEKALEILAERTNAAITHTLDFLRTTISAEKQQLASLHFQS